MKYKVWVEHQSGNIVTYLYEDLPDSPALDRIAKLRAGRSVAVVAVKPIPDSSKVSSKQSPDFISLERGSE